MKIQLLIASLVLVAGSVQAQEYVQGYYRADGTYVQGYYRSAPNNTTLDNYSTKGNTNPYTGQQGTVDPYQQQPLQYQQAPTYEAPKHDAGQMRKSAYGN